MRNHVIVLMALTNLLTISCAQKSIAPTRFEPSYKTMLDPAEAAVAKGCAVASSIMVNNNLPGSVVGKRILETNQAASQPITMTGDPVAWVRSSAREMFRQSGVRTAVSSAPTVMLTLHQIQINETVHVNAGYDARVVIDAAVIDEHGKVCWTERKTGTGQNYGHQGSAEAYRETVDHALDRAIMSVTGDPSFQDALCTQCRK